MKTPIALISSICLVYLSGCATSSVADAVNEFILAGECSSASSFAKQNLAGLSFYYQIARIENECKGNQARSTQLLNLTARYGHEASIDYLRSMNEVIPVENPRPIPRVSVSSPSPPTTSSPSSQQSRQRTNINVYLSRQEAVIGASLCHYSDGSTRRIDGGQRCPRNPPL